MPEIRFRLSLSAQHYLAYYRGAASKVAATAVDGRRVQFPAEHLRPFVTRDGIHGEFILEFDADNRFVALRRAQ